MRINSILGATCAVIFACGFAAPVSAELIGRLPTTLGGDDFQAYYVSDLDMTFTTDANIFGNKSLNELDMLANNLEINGIGRWKISNSLVVEMWDRGYTPSNMQPFTNMEFIYWDGSAGSDDGSIGDCWVEYTSENINDGCGLLAEAGGWTFQVGDVGAVPVPAAIWLFGSGLIGLLGFARRKSSK